MNKVILFAGEHCSGCKVMKERFKSLKMFYADKIEFDEYDVEQHQDKALQYGVISIPAIVFIKNGEPVDTVIGVAPVNSLDRVIQEMLLE